MIAIAAGRVPGDVQRCVELWLTAVRHRDGSVDAPSVSKRIREAFERPIVRFALADPPLAGFALTIHRTDEPHTAVLERIAVDPAAGHRGIGRALLEDAIRAAHLGGCSALELDVRTGNHRAIRFYEAAGFVAVGAPAPHPLGGDPMLTCRLVLS